MYLPPVTIAYSQKAPITRQAPPMIERTTQRIALWTLAAMLRPSVDGPQPDVGPHPLSVASAMPSATGLSMGAQRGRLDNIPLTLAVTDLSITAALCGAPRPYGVCGTASGKAP